jgi:hydroxymethylpyrimidine/phosphomethylpyrimidine kinase
VAAITVQDSRGVHAVSAVAPRVVRAQIEAVLGDLGAEAVKTGMLCSRALVASVASVLERFRVGNLVVDHARLLDRGGVRALCDQDECTSVFAAPALLADDGTEVSSSVLQ